ncbi:MAG: methyltransferase family protein [Thermoanaerobaculia bacterium]
MKQFPPAFLGRKPVHAVPFVAAKLGAFVSWVLFAIDVVRPDDPMSISYWGPPVLFAAGIAIIVAGASHLGDALRVGLPEEDTRLRTGGVYSVTRNPIYVGLYVTLIASLIAVPTIVNAIAALVGIVGHHLIIRGEERFLTDRFGNEWEAYCRSVPRYVFRWRRH